MGLANKYRPKTFDEVVGQTAVIAIKNEIDNNSLGQCLLLCGPAGTGKTTVARIIANRLGAECYELDAASNNGIDFVRLMQEQATKRSMTHDNKVFILDEVHGFSNQAWQAMLKLLEEPPANCYFILCTTETNKIPTTIMSRVQKFFFNPIEVDVIRQRLIDVCVEEEILADDASLAFISVKANGCMRDALSMLDVAAAYNKKMTERSCIEALKEVNPTYISDFISALLNKHINQALRIVTDVARDGISIRSFINSALVMAVNDCKTKFC